MSDRRVDRLREDEWMPGCDLPDTVSVALARLLAVAVTESLREPVGEGPALLDASEAEDGACDDEEDVLWTLVSPCSDFPHGDPPQ